ncbi:hypothetical protein [Methanohalophilus halophilus]|uniref:Uncharacterized protein n=2 Tax=Methanohalophilus TaxID=2175 RepID=A0A1L3Q1Q9_9EURY|nr:hypothetical protein [Methanohalophilus halophilus]APH38806.1 hypothetical protein BHR79_04420 [Methanohalophilus halophilus]RNI08000.1 hypothetical protein EFE40_08595 [Methanohalophilus halophilus]SDW71749.1 hypothetical protein SAMN04515625_1489 [Methanohalophilus halophilus]
MQINLKPIGVIKKSGKNSEILIYSEFEQVIRNMLSRTGKTAVEGNDVLVVHKGDKKDGHQLQVSRTTLLERAGNILKVGRMKADDDSVLDIRLDTDIQLHQTNLRGH